MPLKTKHELSKEVEQLKIFVKELESQPLGTILRKRLAQWVLDTANKKR